MVERFLRVLRDVDVELHRARWDHELGATLFAILCKDRVLSHIGRADWYPCGGRCGERRAVIDAPGEREGRPYLALCSVDNGCLDTHLTDDELRVYAFSFSAAVDLLRRALGVEGATEPRPIVSGVFAIGTIDRGGVRADVLLALNPDDEGLPLFVSARAHAPRPAVVLVNTARWLSQSFVDDHGPGKRVELVLLEDVLAVRDGAIVATTPIAATSAHSPAASTTRPVCVRIDGDGERVLSIEEYDAALASAPRELDLLLDMTVQHHVRSKMIVYVGGRRRNGVYERIEMRRSEAAVAAELIERTCRGTEFVRVRDLKTMHDHDKQTFQRAWLQLDPEPRAFLEKRPGSRDVDAAFRFRAPHGRRWALLKSVG